MGVFLTKPDKPGIALHHMILRHLFRLIGGGASLSSWPDFRCTPQLFRLVSQRSRLPTALANATAMAFSPDGRLFVCQQGGALRVISGGTLLPTPFATVTTTATGERGLLGVTFDPNFATNRFVYVYYTVPTAPTHNRVSRFTASIANPDVAEAGSETVDC